MRLGETAGRLALAGLAAAVALAAGEGALRLAGFSYVIAPQGIEFGWPEPKVMKSRYRIDPDLFWVKPDYPERLRSLASGRPDIVFMGDSCTEFGGYTKEFVARARSAHTGWPRLADQIGVSGYTSYQGLRQLERDVAPLRPRVVTLFFGWNDHWLGFGVEDADIQRVTHSPLARLDGLRLGQLAVKTWMAIKVGPRSTWPLRVPPEEFRRNLTGMARVARDGGIRAVFLTAPTSHETGREPRRLAQRWIDDVSRLVPLHRQYVEIVREVGEATGTPVCDLAREVAALPAEDRNGLFISDGIHFTAPGDRVIAGLLLGCFERDPRLAEFLPGGAPADRSGARGRGPAQDSRVDAIRSSGERGRRRASASSRSATGSPGIGARCFRA